MKVRPRAVLAILVALPFWAAAGSAGATDAPSPVTVGVGIDYTVHGPFSAAPDGVGVANAIDRLARPIALVVPARLAPRGLVPSLTSGLRGLHASDALESAALIRPRSTDEWVSKSRPSKGPMPYVRFSEEERVIGLSFKIQPPPQLPEVASPGL
jgi:hypothetical protein